MNSNLHSNPESHRRLVAAGYAIEVESLGIIDREMGEHSFPPEQWSVVRRVIHTTADFDYARQIRFHPQAVPAAVDAIRRGTTIFCDTRMVQVGLSPWRLGWFGNTVETPMADPRSQELAQKLGVTRSTAAFRLLGEQLNGQIVAVGNAPTALLEVARLIREEAVRPALVIGVPVGFVQAVESKDELWEIAEQPAIVVLGRKGGSAVAVAILHALMEQAKSR